MKSSKVKSTPSTPAPAFKAAPAYQMAPIDIPEALSPRGIIREGNYGEGLGATTTVNPKNGKSKTTYSDQVPDFLRLTNQFDQGLIDQAGQNYYDQQVASPLAAAKSKLINSGQAGSSFAGAQLGQLEAQGRLDQFRAGLEMQQALQQNMLNNRTSYFNGVPRISQEQNALDINRGIAESGLNVQQYGDMNRYNLGATGMENNFNQGIYGTKVGFESNAQQVQAQKDQQSGFLGLGSLLMGGGQMAAQGLGSLLGGPVGGSVAGSGFSALGGGTPITSIHGPLAAAGGF